MISQPSYGILRFDDGIHDMTLMVIDEICVTVGIPFDILAFCERLYVFMPEEGQIKTSKQLLIVQLLHSARRHRSP
jgi:hypothetical protein